MKESGIRDSRFYKKQAAAQDGRQLAFYSDSNIKVKFCEDPPSSQPCPFFLQRTGQRLFLALTDGLPPMHSTLLCWGIRIKTENQFFTSSHSLPISCAVSVQTFAALLPLFSCGFSLCVPAVISTPVAILYQCLFPASASLLPVASVSDFF